MSSLSEVLTRNLSDSFSTSFRQSSYTNIQSIQSLPSYAATVTHQIQEAAQCRCPHSLLQLFSLPNKKQALEIKVQMVFITAILIVRLEKGMHQLQLQAISSGVANNIVATNTILK